MSQVTLLAGTGRSAFYQYFSDLWLAFLALIYGGDIPGGSNFVIMAGSLGLALANMLQVPLAKVVKPVFLSVLFAGVLCIFVMPQLSSFLGLGLLIFVATFAICYWFAAPQQMLGRTFGLAMFVTIASISNHQSYRKEQMRERTGAWEGVLQ